MFFTYFLELCFVDVGYSYVFDDDVVFVVFERGSAGVVVTPRVNNNAVDDCEPVMHKAVALAPPQLNPCRFQLLIF